MVNKALDITTRCYLFDCLFINEYLIRLGRERECALVPLEGLHSSVSALATVCARVAPRVHIHVLRRGLTTSLLSSPSFWLNKIVTYYYSLHTLIFISQYLLKYHSYYLLKYYYYYFFQGVWIT